MHIAFEYGYAGMLNAIKTVVREYKWPPEVFGGFFIDSIDELGLYFWYLDVKEVVESLKAKDK